MGQCRVCGAQSRLIAEVLSACADCLRRHPQEALPAVLESHAAIRAEFNLPAHPPQADGGIPCPLCTNLCRLGEGDVGLCGLRTAADGRLKHLAGTPQGALVSWYDDPLPTNCVADWVCAESRQRGMVNQAVFYEACIFGCIYCQNWHFRLKELPDRISAKRLVDQAHGRTHASPANAAASRFPYCSVSGIMSAIQWGGEQNERAHRITREQGGRGWS